MTRAADRLRRAATRPPNSIPDVASQRRTQRPTTVRVARNLVRGAWRRGNAIADGRLSTRLAHDPDGPVLILSPHHDDAVFNCWSVLDAALDVRVVNVFGGIPKDGTLTEWDRICGAEDSAARMRERIEEDRVALGMAGRAAVELPFLDTAYRRVTPLPRLAAIDAAVVRAVPSPSTVYAPVGADHPAHLHVRRYADALADAGIPTELYGEIPYLSRMGWPPWVTGEPADPYVNPEAYWSWTSVIPDRDLARPVALDDGRATAKLGAMRAYRSQFPAIDGGPLGLISNRAVHGFEVFWRAVPARGSTG